MVDIPLDPGNGGQSILPSVLQPGDIILSTTAGWGSDAIRAVTGGGPASHIRIYASIDGRVIAAEPGAGVTITQLDGALVNDSVAVGFRYPNITLDDAASVVSYAFSKLGLPYDYFGAVLDGLFQFSQQSVQISLGTPENHFFCSSLVVEAYSNAGIPLTTVDPVFNDPNAIVPLQWFDQIEYLGHLKFTP